MNLFRNLYLSCTALLLISLSVSSQTVQPQKLPRPKLVVGLVVDQMRWDYLYRFYERYGTGGFKRMLREGFTCENTFINHLPSVTAIGHSTIYTGTVPAVHGITGNAMLFNSTGVKMNCVADENVQGVGTDLPVGKASPFNLLASTIGDELKLATNFRSKVIGISLKDRGAILPAGHAANAAYWFSTKEGKFITSTYYMKALPAWVTSFNGLNLSKKYLLQDWKTMYPVETYIQSSPDDVSYEGLLKGQKKSVFPVETSKAFTEDDYSVIYSTPYGNSIVLDFAKAAIDAERLGGGNDTDLLTVSLSSTDAIGHMKGVNSVEIEDTYLRLDAELANFFSYLDKKVGKGSYTLFLTADHGASGNGKFLSEGKLKINEEADMLEERLGKALESQFKVAKLIKEMSYSQVRFDFKLLREKKLNEEEVSKFCVDFLKKEPNIAYVVDNNKIGDASVPEEIKTKIINGYNPERSGAIHFIYSPNSISLKSKGSSHSKWNPYDSKIPLLWMGWGINQGSLVREIHMQDIAPTVTTLLKIQNPNGSIGKAIPEVLKK
jgi:predicted AlkP superfamily pyrophosphatase or phosphodiesterase